MSPFTVLLSLILCFTARSFAGQLSVTDTITWGGDPSRAGYFDSHNLDPEVVGSAQFGQLFKTILPGNYLNAAEQVFSQPLVYTLDDGIQYVFVATTQNNVYKINAKTGVIVASRNLHIPFLTSDLNGCVDINPLIGVTATGVIDPDTDTWYLTSKTYALGTTSGKPNGRYYFHAIDVNTLNEQANFPINLEGIAARNNPSRIFNGGIHHQRPALLHQGQFVYAGFASHCVQYNFTGWIMGWDKTTGAVVEHYATEGSPVPNTTPGGGVWMSGGGLTSDGEGSIWFATGNGYASQLSDIAVPGRQPPTALEEAAVHMTINDDGSLQIIDFFMPFEKQALDGADRDLGTSPLELLPTSTFTCPNVKRIGIVTGKSGKTYLLNMDNLGGYQMGPNHGDAALQVIQNENSVYAGAGVYPLEGGYIYINVIQYPTHVFKFSCDQNGNPALTKVADSPTDNAYVLGVGHGTTSSLNGQAGTGLVWTSDVEGYNLRIYNAIPSNGYMTLLNEFNVPGVTKFTRPVFGDGTVYLGTTVGAFYGFGSPVNLPFNCSSPYDFGTVVIGSSSSARTVTCQANINTQVTSINLAGNPNFAISGLPTVPLTVAAGKTFSFQAVFQPNTPGSLSSDVVLNTTNSVTGYSVNTHVSLKGTGESLSPILSISPVTLSFGQVITGETVDGTDSSLIFSNLGDSAVTITNIAYSQVSEGGATVTPNGTASAPQIGPFTFTNIPTTIPGKSQLLVNVNFNPNSSGNFAVYLTVSSNGGTKVVDVVGTSATYPKSLIEFQAADGSGNWIAYQNGTDFSFGDVTEQQTKTLKMRLTNQGDSSAGRLSVTVSKPPFGVSGLIAAVNNIDLAEGTTLAAGESATADLFCSVPKSQVNVDSYNGTAQWTLNTNDPDQGKLFIQFFCDAVSEQVGPLASNGSAVYRYLECAVENNPGRQLSTQLYGEADNTNEKCIATCAKAGYKYCATQYESECWAGNSIPIASTLARDCNYACAGNINETCGGNGYFQNGAFMSLFYNPSLPEGAALPQNNNGGSTSLGVPATIGSFSYVGCYSEATTGRALSSGAIATNDMTLQYCAGNMSQYTYWGVEYGRECYGGNSLGAGSANVSASDCSMACAGNSSEACGAGDRLQLYQQTSSATGSSTGSATSTSATPTPTGPVVASVPGYSFLGCYTESQNGRALSSSTSVKNTMTVELCAQIMSQYTYFATEYGSECYGSNSLASDSTKTVLTDCSMTCAGNASEYCGAGNRLSLYQQSGQQSSSSGTVSSTATGSSSSSSAASTPTGPVVAQIPGYSYQGCYTEGTSGRALAASTKVENVMTVDLCAQLMSQYAYFGVEYSTECYGANSLSTGSILASSNDCSMLCGGNATEYCGAGNRLSLYQKTSGSTSTSTSTASSITSTLSGSLTSSSLTTATSTSATPSSTGPINAAIAGYSYLGCYTEATSARALAASSVVISQMTVEYCAQQMSAFAYFGLEYSTECYGANSLSSGSVIASSSDCSMLCGGNQTEYCGAGNRLSLYQRNASLTSTSSAPSTASSSTSTGSLTTSTTSSSATPSSTGPSNALVAGYSFIGCYSEGTSARALAASTVVTNKMTVEYCAQQMSAYAYFGVEYSSECYGANSLSTGSVLEPISDCSMLCAGNSSEYCGAGNRLSLYQKSSGLTSTSTGSSTTASSATSTASSSTSTTSSATSTVSSATSTVSSGTSTASSGTSTLSSGTSTTTTVSSGVSGSLSSTSTASSGTSTLSSATSTVTSTSSTPSSTGPVIAVIPGYNYSGCYTEATSARALASAAHVANNMTVEYCAQLMQQYQFFGVEYGSECYGSNSFSAGSVLVPNKDCSMLCSGNSTEYCGNGNRLNVYNVTSTSSTASLTTSSGTVLATTSSTSTSSGSSTTTSGSSTSITSSFSSSVTPSATSSTSGSSTSSVGTTGSGTGMTSSSQLSSSFSTSTITSSSSSSSSGQSSSSTPTSSSSSSSSMTPTSSTSTSSGSSTVSSTSSMSSTTSSSSSSSSSSATTATTSTITANIVSSSTITASLITSTSTSSSTSTSTTTSSSSGSITGSATNSVSITSSTTSSSTTSASPTSTKPVVVEGNVNFTYYNCVVEPLNSRALPTLVAAMDNMTVEYCLSLSWEYKWAGLEYHRECWAANSLNTTAAPNATSETQCNDACKGDQMEICGGSNRLTTYSNNVTLTSG
ncbi:hypothetical protein MMC20_000808 [Loxospora ochrophaea]|nr:hypothetical protein [Loxospora ochrophaea]